MLRMYCQRFGVTGVFAGFTLLLVFAGACPVQAGPSLADTVRFLQQSSFGPTPPLISRVQQVGFAAFLNEQFSAPTMVYPNLEFWPQTRPTSCTGPCQRDNYTLYPLQRHFFSNALAGEDQLRQRVAFALSQILVTSAVDVPLPSWMRGYQQLLYRSAFGNYRQLLYDVSLNPAMGRFLDMVNNRCQTPTPPNANICRNGLKSQPNENYAREILQLFALGTFLLNQDGTRQLDNNGNPIAAYDEKTVQEFARVFTGWVLAPALAGAAETGGTVPNYRDPMVVHKNGQGLEDYHDRGSKTLLSSVSLGKRRGSSPMIDWACPNSLHVARAFAALIVVIGLLVRASALDVSAFTCAQSPNRASRVAPPTAIWAATSLRSRPSANSNARWESSRACRS